LTIRSPCPTAASYAPLATPATTLRACQRRCKHRPEWQAAAEALLLVAERGGPTMFGGVGVMQALNTGKPDPEITQRRKRAKRYRIVK
jgi:hypothetical protein